MFFHATEVLVDKDMYINENIFSAVGWRNAFLDYISRVKKPDIKEQLRSCVTVIEKAIQNNVDEVAISSKILHKNKCRILIEASFMFEVDYKSFKQSLE